jgi:hypothetical protein
MKKRLLVPFVIIVVLLLGVSAQATLVDMNDGTIYDTTTQLSWLKNANTEGLMTWNQAVVWTASLNNNGGFAGLTGWRLPVADAACQSCISNEMGYLYTSLGNVAGGPLTNNGPFLNWQAAGYWSGTDYALNPAWALDFYFKNYGGQESDAKTGFLYAWAVRSGARSQSQSRPVPASGTVSLIGMGLAGLIIVGTRLKKATR